VLMGELVMTLQAVNHGLYDVGVCIKDGTLSSQVNPVCCILQLVHDLIHHLIHRLRNKNMGLAVRLKGV